MIKTTVKITAPAKINLGLCITKKRDDGYHEIKTLFQAVNLYDTLEISLKGKGIELFAEGEAVPTDNKNILWKAAQLFLSRLDSPTGVQILLKKRIPVAAGLGGGSSDAAAALKGLNRLFHSPLPQNNLLEMGEQLGADVPFFLFGNSAMGEGIGTKLTSTPALSKTWVVIANPGFPVSTKWVYSNINIDLLLTKKTDHINMLRLFLGKNDLPKIGRHLHNDLEAVVIRRYPVIKKLKKRLLSEGALGAVMSGSGASVFGIFNDRLLAEQVFDSIRKEDTGWKIFLTEPLK